MSFRPAQVFRCRRCGARITVWQPDPILTYAVKFPLNCHISEGGCGRSGPFEWIESKLDILAEDDK
jgi:hypothetical protein